MASYKKTSHLKATPISNGYADLYVPPLVPDLDRTEQFTISQKYVQRPDLLAYDLYGEARLWWLFAIYNKNDIVDPINDFTLNKVILVPKRDAITGI